MTLTEYRDLFGLAIRHKNEGLKFEKLDDPDAVNEEELLKAIEILERLYPYDFHPDKFNKAFLLGALYRFMGNYSKAFEMLSIATTLKPDSELASLSLYLTYIKLDESHNAINEIERYLNSYTANLYKDTLLELLGEIKDGRLPLYRERIFILAERHGVILT